MDNIHEALPSFINDNKLIINSYDDISNVILKMIREKYFFNMDKNILRGCLEDLTYMYCPGDDINKDRVMSMLEPSDDEEESDDEDGEMNQMEFLKQMMSGMAGGMPGGMPPQTPKSTTPKPENESPSDGDGDNDE
tara:strand:- start:399 stop:806 length:408 start_codon:yes stop_codon:yes gene_type:complete